MGCVPCVEIYLGHQIGQHHTALNGHNLLQTIQGKLRHLFVILQRSMGRTEDGSYCIPAVDASPTHLLVSHIYLLFKDRHKATSDLVAPTPLQSPPLHLLSQTVKATLVGV